jgi:hypothetical protein
MKMKAKVLAAIATAATVVGLAYATPIVNLAQRSVVRSQTQE